MKIQQKNCSNWNCFNLTNIKPCLTKHVMMLCLKSISWNFLGQNRLQKAERKSESMLRILSKKKYSKKIVVSSQDRYWILFAVSKQMSMLGLRKNPFRYCKRCNFACKYLHCHHSNSFLRHFFVPIWQIFDFLLQWWLNRGLEML